MHDEAYLIPTFEIVNLLRSHNIEPVVYGSVGTSLYLGLFKAFNDIDLLLDDQWLDERWLELQTLLYDDGFRLTDEREHEFEDSRGRSPSFAKKGILLRDQILHSFDELVSMQTRSGNLTTLSPEGFLRAYAFSVKDGYRKAKRGKKDEHIIALLQDYIENNENLVGKAA